MNNKQVELLAPAGSFEALEAAINSGADAIYLGGQDFGARQYASNFDDEELIKAVDLAHLYRVRIYVTVNTLVDNNEISKLKEYLIFLHKIGVDAIIVQDFGVAALARKVVPELKLHASTQMSIMNSAGVKIAEHLGMERVVLARECSIAEIEEICRESIAEIEVFIHGALCISYSGQCLMSSLIGGRSGNRGRCAQPCRLQYTLVDEDLNDLLPDDVGEYLLSPKDLNCIEIMPQLIDAGVKSFKIEGRMKRPEYVAVVVSAYRKAIDSHFAAQFQVSAQDKQNLTQIFNRDFTTAYLLDRPGRTMMSDKRPNNRGVQIGRVLSYQSGSNIVTLKLECELNLGDGIEFWVTVGGRVTMTVDYLEVDGQEVQSAPAGSEVCLFVPSAVRDNDRVFRTFDSKLMQQAQSMFSANNMCKIPVTAHVEAFVNHPMTITFTDDEGNKGSAKTQFIGQIAQKRPLEYDTVHKQVSRLGTTAFALTELTIDSDSNVMFPISEINEARRCAIEELLLARIAAYTSDTGIIGQYKLPGIVYRVANTKLSVHVDTFAKAQAAYAAGADVVILGAESFCGSEISLEDCQKFVELARKLNKTSVLATARIIKEFNLAYNQDRLAKYINLQPDAICVGSISLLEPAVQSGLPVWVDVGLNTYNSLALDYWQEKGVSTVLLSPELTMQQVEDLAQRTTLELECVVQGRMQMMISEYCITGSFLGNIHKQDCYGACNIKRYLKDRKDELFPVVNDQFCRTHILNSKELSMLAYVSKFMQIGINYLRIDARYMDTKELKIQVAEYKQALEGNLASPKYNNNYTKGHYFRGVL